MANSILLFDEAQMFPVEYMIPVLRSLEALVRHFSCSALLCSATQPRLDQFLQGRPQELMEDIPGLYDFSNGLNWSMRGCCPMTRWRKPWMPSLRACASA